jgi:putative Flp pilus-assembly TadE/G-like protein
MILSRWWRSRSGNIAIISAICLPALVGFCGMAADTGYWFYQSRQLQAAADIAAFDGAVVISQNGNSSAINAAATSGATGNGWVSSQGTITINDPPKSGTHQNNESVEVILTENVPRYFTLIYSQSPVPLSARGVGTAQGSHVACVIALDPTAAGALTVSGNGNLSSPNCDVVSDSNSTSAISMQGASQMTVPCAVSVGTASVTSGLHLDKCTSPTNHAPVATDPYRNVPKPTPGGGCLTVTHGQTSFSPGHYCAGISINWSAAVTFQPGVYYIDGGGFSLSAQANVSGAGVTFYLFKGNTVTINGGATVTLSAPTSGTYSGITFFGDRGGSTSDVEKLNGGSSTSITGVIYFPSESVQYNGNTGGESTCTQLVADLITVTGTANFNNVCAGDGVSTTNVVDGSPGSVTLAE